MDLFGPYRSHFLSKKSLIAAKNETKEERRKEEEETPLVHVNRPANILFTREWGRSYVAQGYCVSQATQAEWRYQDTSPPPPLSIVYKTGWFPRIEAEREDGLYLET